MASSEAWKEKIQKVAKLERFRVNWYGMVFGYGLDRIPKDKDKFFKNFTVFEKTLEDGNQIEDFIVNKSRFQFEEDVKENPHDYDIWLDYLRLVESDPDADTVRELYERAIANVPPITEKRHWKRYIYLWINYARFEELEVKDPERTRQVYQACLELIPYEKFTFAKIWLLYGQFEVRQKELQNARRILDTSIGRCPKNKLFKGYIVLELQLREFNRCRKLYEKYLLFSMNKYTTWLGFIKLERRLGKSERLRAIFDLCISQPCLDLSEDLWQSYIDFEIEEEEYENARRLYKRFLQHTQKVKVWISYAQFELSIGDEEQLQRCRQVYEEANHSLRTCKDKEERLVLLKSWNNFEQVFGTVANKDRVKKLMPEKMKMWQKLTAEDGSDAGWEEYYDYIFPDDAANQSNPNLLEVQEESVKPTPHLLHSFTAKEMSNQNFSLTGYFHRKETKVYKVQIP